MNRSYVLGLDQSTQGTKALLCDPEGELLARCDRPHRQIIDSRGWVEHDPEEIWRNVLACVKDVIHKAAIAPSQIAALGVSNQRETAMAWNGLTGEPVCNAIVWQCPRGAALCDSLAAQGAAPLIKERTGLNLSPYFSAAKLAWIVQNIPEANALNGRGALCCGTMDSWLLYRLTRGGAFKTDFSNASRTQLFNLNTLAWDSDIAGLFGLSPQALPEVCDSDACFGYTDFEGLLPNAIPIHAMLGDSHGALYGQGCHTSGMVKATYGTGSSVMMNTGGRPVFMPQLSTSLAWCIGGKAEYVLEGNINYTGAVITWLKDDLHLIQSAAEAGTLARLANPNDETYLVPAFSGLGAPYWKADVKAALTGMSRSTGRNEIVRAAEDCIAYQINDILKVITSDAGITVSELRVDGGPTRDSYLMQFQSDITNCPVLVSHTEELSGIGAAYLAGIAAGIYQKEAVFARMSRSAYHPQMENSQRQRRLNGWKNAVEALVGQK